MLRFSKKQQKNLSFVAYKKQYLFIFLNLTRISIVKYSIIFTSSFNLIKIKIKKLGFHIWIKEMTFKYL